MAVYILIAILMFGLLIAVHEFGHFAAAKLMGVRVNEFAIGMGPRILHKKSGETEYTLRLFPIGGFCAMEGEEEDSSDPRAMSNQPAWRRLIILVAGAFMNFVTGALIFLLLSGSMTSFATTTIASLTDGYPLKAEGQLLPGDQILKIDGHQIYLQSDIGVFLNRGGETMDVEVLRYGQRVSLPQIPMPYLEKPMVNSEGNTQMVRVWGLSFVVKEATLFDKLQNAWYNIIDTVRLVWVSLGDLISGAVGIRDMSGPVGITSIISQAGKSGGSLLGATLNIAYIVAFIAINLAVMNLLPIPALDGGQILFLLVDKVYSLFSKRRINPKYLGYINMAGFFLLIALMVVVAVSDVLKQFGW
ncbi:MAG: site-2 protease family protein [Pseudoflavonifractor sp.]